MTLTVTLHTSDPHLLDMYLVNSLIPSFLSENDPRPAVEQLHAAYGHGGGWNAFNGFTLDPETYIMTYPRDPDTLPVASIKLREETIILYPHAWVAVLYPSGTYEVCRMD